MNLFKGKQQFPPVQKPNSGQKPLIVIQVSNQEEWETWVQELKRQVCHELEQMLRWGIRLTIVTCCISGGLQLFRIFRKIRKRKLKRVLEQLKPASITPAALRQHESPEVPLCIGCAPQWSLLDVGQLTADKHPGFEVFCQVFNTYKVQDLFMFIVSLKNDKSNEPDLWEAAEPWNEDMGLNQRLESPPILNFHSKTNSQQDITQLGEQLTPKSYNGNNPQHFMDHNMLIDAVSFNSQLELNNNNKNSDDKNLNLKCNNISENLDNFTATNSEENQESTFQGASQQSLPQSNLSQQNLSELQIADMSNSNMATEKLIADIIEWENSVEIPIEDAVKKFSLQINSGKFNLRQRRWGITKFPAEYSVDASEDLIAYLRTLALVVLQDDQFEYSLDTIQAIGTPRSSIGGDSQTSARRIQFQETVQVQEIEMVQPNKPKRKPKKIGEVSEIIQDHAETQNTSEKQISFIQQIQSSPKKFRYGKTNSSMSKKRGSKLGHGVCEVCTDKYNLRDMVFCSGGHGVCIPCLRQYTLLTHGLRAGGAVVRCVVMEAHHGGKGTLRRCEGSYPSKVLQQCLKPTEYLQLQMFDYLRDIRVATLDSISFRCYQCGSTGVIPLAIIERGGMVGCISAGCTAFYCTRCGKQCTRLGHFCSADPQESPLLHWAMVNRKQVRNCPNCGLIIEKTGGCHHMICPSAQGGCGYEFCWRCTDRWTVAHYLCGQT